ncbi:MAG: ABC transporter ATP-binding protein [Candidatus Bathyarchaeota archaeon]|nr:ABC transporter ATP-binding protein [Candidatus Bathyarchaeota archaeon]
MTLIAELKDVTKVLGATKVLDNVNLQINKGEILALLGPNGSGKTTLLKILAFLETPTFGEVKFQGGTVHAKNAELFRMRSTMVFQKATFFDASVYKNIAYGLKLRRLAENEIRGRVKEALMLVKLEGFERRSARKLSGGEQQRVAIARAIVLNTPLLLLDEPTANLDPKNVAIVEEVIAAINRGRGITIVLATHNMFQAEKLPQRVALINNGQIKEVGETSDVFGKLSRNLASFAAIDNTFKGIASDTGSGTTVVDVGNNVKVEVTTQQRGEISFFVSPQDIILSKSAIASSARNVFKGKIVAISDSGSLVKLTVDVGQPFVVQITKRSFVEMGLNLNAEVYLAFKASSVQVL